MNELKKKTKCYIYTRVSTAIQVDGYSLDAQKDKLRKYAEFQDIYCHAGGREHEAIIAEEDWELAQEKRSKNNYRREKIHDPEHAHILSRILKCLCCEKGMYGNIAKAGRKDNKTRYYYYCKNTVNAQMKLKPLWFGLFLILIET